MTSYPVKRPRLALSCLVCTRRKVRCGREQPHCSNCERLGETCVYNPGTRDPGTGRVLRAGDNEDSNDGEGPMPNTQKPGNHQSSLDMFFKAPEQGAPYDALALSRDRLSVRNAQFRYVGKSFWGFVNSHERLTDSMFHDDNDQPDLPPSHISVTLLAKSLHLFPTKHASDALVQAFKVGVYTIFPLINIQKFRSDYDSFWACFDPNRAMTPPPSLVQDPTFTCLNFAVLFAGASVATESAWSVLELKGIERKGMIDRLEKACHDSLAACKYTEHPTLNTLAASLLVHHFTKHEPLAGAAFIASIVRLAQSMGLHQDHEEDNALIRESRRRIWWHIVWFDVQTSLATGLPTCCGDALEKVPMIDPFIAALPPQPGESETPVENRQSVLLRVAIGRYETARVQHHFIQQFQNACHVSGDKVIELFTATSVLRCRINKLISELHGMGTIVKSSDHVRRDCFVSMINATPESQGQFFDELKEGSVFSWWADLVLVLLQSEATITLQKYLLTTPDCRRLASHMMWSDLAELCLNYLELSTALQSIPAFKPWAWFGPTYYCQDQCAFLLFIYSKHQLSPGKKGLSRSCVETSFKSRSLARPPWAKTESSLLTCKTINDLWGHLDNPDDARNGQSSPVSDTPLPVFDVVSTFMTELGNEGVESLTSQVARKGFSSLKLESISDLIFKRWFCSDVSLS